MLLCFENNTNQKLALSMLKWLCKYEPSKYVFNLRPQSLPVRQNQILWLSQTPSKIMYLKVHLHVVTFFQSFEFCFCRFITVELCVYNSAFHFTRKKTHNSLPFYLNKLTYNRKQDLLFKCCCFTTNVLEQSCYNYTFLCIQILRKRIREKRACIRVIIM